MARYLFFALLTVGGAGAAFRSWADEPQARFERTKQVRKYLSVLLQKFEMSSDTEYVNNLQNLSNVCKTLIEGGIVSPLEVNELQGELLRARIRDQKQQSAYQDALDRFKLEFNLPMNELFNVKQVAEEAAARQLGHQINVLMGISSDFAKLRHDLSTQLAGKKLPEPRMFLHAVTTTTNSPLFKDSPFGKHFSLQWRKWEQQKDVKKALREYQVERRRLLDLEADFAMKNQTLPPKDRERLKEIEFQLDLGNLEIALREFDKQPWKVHKDERVRTLALQAKGRQVYRAIAPLFSHARNELLDLLKANWPELPPVPIQKTDMLKCAWEDAQKILKTLLPKKNELAECQTMVRRLRTLADIYPSQKELLVVSSSQVDMLLETLTPPTPVTPGNFGNPTSNTLPLASLLRALRSQNRADKQLCKTWFQYQMTRLDLVQTLKLPVPVDLEVPVDDPTRPPPRKKKPSVGGKG
jgi:hypothetical protein